MTPTPAEFEIKRRPVWDPAPGTACIWQCIKEMPLAMHRLSDRVLGGLYVAIDCGLIKKANCSLNESDLGENFNIRVLRANLNLGHGLLTPDEKAVVAIPIKRESKTVIFELRGAGKANMRLPVIVYNTDVFKARYPNWAEWRDELLYERRSDGTVDKKDFESFPGISTDSIPPDWPQGLTRDRELASEAHYRLENLNTKTGLPKDGMITENKVQNPYSTRSQACQPAQADARSLRLVAKSPSSSIQALSIAEIIDGKYGFKDHTRRRVVAVTANCIGSSYKIDPEDDIDAITKPRKKAKEYYHGAHAV